MTANNSNHQIAFSLLEGMMNTPKAVDALKRDLDRVNPILMRSSFSDNSQAYWNARFELAIALKNLTLDSQQDSPTVHNENYMKAIRLFDEVSEKATGEQMAELRAASYIGGALLYTWLHPSTAEDGKSYHEDALKRFEHAEIELQSQDDDSENNKVYDPLDKLLSGLTSSEQAQAWVWQRIAEIRGFLVSNEKFDDDSEKEPRWKEVALAYDKVFSYYSSATIQWWYGSYRETVLKAGIAHFEAGDAVRAVERFKQGFKMIKKNGDKNDFPYHIYSVAALSEAGFSQKAAKEYRSLSQTSEFQTLFNNSTVSSNVRDLANSLKSKAENGTL